MNTGMEMGMRNLGRYGNVELGNRKWECGSQDGNMELRYDSQQEWVGMWNGG